jgi:hypothetical protein
MAVDPTPVPVNPGVAFPNWARVLLSLIFGLAGYLVAGEVVDQSLSALLAGLVLVLSSAGVVPPSPEIVKHITPQLGLVLTVVVTALAYIVNTPDIIEMSRTVQGLITAVLALFASLGITPPQAKVTRAD